MMTGFQTYLTAKFLLVLGGLLFYTAGPGNDVQNLGERRPCPCSKDKLCQIVKKKVKTEVFAFSVDNQHWQDYDWNKLTTVVEFGYHDDELMCQAHSQDVRVLMNANFPVNQLTNITARRDWVTSQVASMTLNFLDGINVDFESEIDFDRQDLKNGLTELIQELRTAVKAKFTDGVVTADLAWSPDCIDKRCYDYKAIIDIVDAAFIMAYDERSQIYGPCIAYANSAYDTTKSGLMKYLALGVDVKKLILGLPWYGYKYPCQSYDKSKTPPVCTIPFVPFRGVNCSDAAGSEVSYGTISKEISHSMSGKAFDQSSLSPYMDVKDPTTGEIYQYWFDDVQSLTLKYELAKDLGLAGVGMWNSDSIDYTDPKQVNEMWGALP